jgi:signal transduction histidine kinase
VPKTLLVLPRIASGFAVIIGLVVLVGWWGDIESLKRTVPGFVAMNPITAVLFILSGVALALALYDGLTPFAKQIRKVLAAIVMGLAIAELIELTGVWHSPVDEWLFSSKLWDARNALPNRMAPNTAFNFVLAGLALWTFDPRGKRSFSQAVAIVMGFGAILPLTGYAYGVRSFSGLAAFIPMAVHTAATFLLLAAGLVFAVPHAALIEPFTTRNPRGVLARRLFPLVVLLILFLGWLRLWGERRELYDSAFGTVLFAIALSVLFVVLLRWTVATVGRLEAERDAMNTRLHNLNRRKDEMIAVVSHDLCSPLTGFRMVIDLLRERRQEPTQELLGIMDHSAKRMVSMVRGLLDISKLQADKVELELEDLRVSEIVRQAMEPLLINASAKNIRLEILADPAEPMIRADRLRVSQIFSNLLTNAVKFTASYGSVLVTVEPSEDGVQVNVRDTGVGIPKDELEHVFDKFRQTAAKATAGEMGTGLGLAIVRELVLLHGGKITVSSELNRGSVFTVLLPAEPQPPERAARPET